MPNLLEDPLPYLFVGVAVEAILAVLLVNTRRGAFLIAILCVLAVIVVGVGVERFVVTEREEVELALDELAAALEANDVPRVLSLITSEATFSRSRAEWAMGRIEVTSAKIRNLDVTVNHLTRYQASHKRGFRPQRLRAAKREKSMAAKRPLHNEPEP